MNNPENVTRILFQSFPDWMLVMFYVAAIATIVLFVYGCYVNIRKYRRGQPPTIRSLGAGLWGMVDALLSHRPIRRRDTA
ncbi:MAG: Fe-S oxidoreductase, partial [Gammaproteobacteria bacterium]|nr:Fe-S oxidoreductase [Gammaproteobacteria bacterium]